MSVSVGIITAQMLQDADLKGIGVQGKQSTPSGAVDAEIYQNALSMPRVSNQRSAGASDLIDSAHQGEGVRPEQPLIPVKPESFAWYLIYHGNLLARRQDIAVQEGAALE